MSPPRFTTWRNYTKPRPATGMPNRSTSGPLRLIKRPLARIIPMSPQSLNGLAELYETQGRYRDAEPLYKRSLAIDEKAHGPEHPHVATSLNNLAGLYEAQARYGGCRTALQAVACYFDKGPWPGSPQVATWPNQHKDQRTALKRPLRYMKKAHGPSKCRQDTQQPRWIIRPRAATAWPNRSHKRSLAILKKALGPDHPLCRHRAQQPGCIIQGPGPLRGCRTALQAVPCDR